jgi:hypothetical protein
MREAEIVAVRGIGRKEVDRAVVVRERLLIVLLGGVRIAAVVVGNGGFIPARSPTSSARV